MYKTLCSHWMPCLLSEKKKNLKTKIPNFITQTKNVS